MTTQRDLLSRLPGVEFLVLAPAAWEVRPPLATPVIDPATHRALLAQVTLLRASTGVGAADGSTVLVGQDIWDENKGVRNIESVLNQLSVPDLAGWGGLTGLAMSSDGRTIIGEAFNPQGDVEVWCAVLPVKPFAPEFNAVPVGNYQVQAGQNISFNISATDGDLNQFVQYRLIGKIPSTVTFTGVEFLWSPTIDEIGDHAFTIRAYDNCVPSRYTDSQFTITVTV